MTQSLRIIFAASPKQKQNTNHSNRYTIKAKTPLPSSAGRRLCTLLPSLPSILSGALTESACFLVDKSHVQFKHFLPHTEPVTSPRNPTDLVLVIFFLPFPEDRPTKYVQPLFPEKGVLTSDWYSPVKFRTMQFYQNLSVLQPFSLPHSQNALDLNAINKTPHVSLMIDPEVVSSLLLLQILSQ